MRAQSRFQSEITIRCGRQKKAWIVVYFLSLRICLKRLLFFIAMSYFESVTNSKRTPKIKYFKRKLEWK